MTHPTSLDLSSFHYLVFGLVQGFTEYLPVSSSAHLVLFPYFLGIQDPGLAFDVFLHLGTLCATVFYFWKDWKQILLSTATRGVSLITLVIGTVPAMLVGGLFSKTFSGQLRSPIVIAFTLAVGGLLLVLVDRKRSLNRKTNDLTCKDALLVGMAQCLALIPGISRSGITITAGRWLALDRASAARFSFLLSAPITFAALSFELLKLAISPPATTAWSGWILGASSAFLSGLLGIFILTRFVGNAPYFVYATYRVVLASIILFTIA